MNPAEPVQSRSRGRAARLIVLACAAVALALALALLPLKQWLIDFLEWTDALGFWGPFLVAVFYVIACVFMLPGLILTMGAGVLFGVGVGTVTCSVGSTLGASAAFLVGRFLARDWVARRVSGNPKFAAVDEAVGRQGFKIVLLTRLSPIFPFNFQNYAYGLTGVPFWKYFFASWIGMLPGTIMYVYLGQALGSLATLASGEKRDKTTGEWVLFGVGLLVTVVVATVVARIAGKAIKEAVPDQRTHAGEGETAT